MPKPEQGSCSDAAIIALRTARGDDEAMNAAPPVTIGMPVYNGERYVDEALESILAQSHEEFVLVVGDNASTDSTEEIVRSYAARDKRIRYLASSENHGAAWNYNRVFAECSSPFFKWAASDDLLAPTCVERCLETLAAEPDTVVLAYPLTRLIGPDGELLGDAVDQLAIRSSSPHRRLRQVVRNVVWGNVIFALMRSPALRRTRGHGSYPSADWVLLAELALLGEFREVAEPLFLRREHDGMSRRANATTAEVARWFDPTNAEVEPELRRLFREHLAAIRHAPLARHERVLAEAALAATWVRRHNRIGPRLRTLVSRAAP